jgi:hypothetical protein
VPSVREFLEWQERVARFQRSGSSIAQFCYDEGVSTPSFYVWRRKLRRKLLPSGSIGAGRFARGSTEAAQSVRGHSRRGSFVPVRLLGGVNVGDQVTMTAELRGGTRLTIPLAGPNALQVAIAALVQADAEGAGERPC